MADQHTVFLSEVQENGFAAIAAAFSRGALNMSRLEDITVWLEVPLEVHPILAVLLAAVLF